MDILAKGNYFFKYVLFKPIKLKNLISVKLSKFFKLPRVRGMPLTLMLEPANYCNLKCPLCPTGAGLLKRKKAAMSFNDFKKILDELGPYVIHLRLWNWGEPLLNAELYKMISYAKKYKIFVNTSTNSFFLNESNAKKIVESGLDELIISLDGASEETYSKYRKKSDFSEVIKAMKLLVNEKIKRNSKTPLIKLQFIIMRHNEHEIKKVIQLAKQIGVNEIFFKTVGLMDTDVKEDITKYMPLNPKYSRYNLVQGKIRSKQEIRNFCDYLWDEATINADGSVVPCCKDAHNAYVFGNALKQKFKEIWNNKKYAGFRKQVLKNKNKIVLCNNCPGNKKEFKIGEIKLK